MKTRRYKSQRLEHGARNVCYNYSLPQELDSFIRNDRSLYWARACLVKNPKHERQRPKSYQRQQNNLLIFGVLGDAWIRTCLGHAAMKQRSHYDWHHHLDFRYPFRTCYTECTNLWMLSIKEENFLEAKEDLQLLVY